MTQAELHQAIDAAALSDHLSRCFDVGRVRGFSLVHGGYMSQNFRVDTDRGPFFLKQYRNRISSVVYEIKCAEEHFADHGLPVITPVHDRFGRPAFWFNGIWYSLFPFAEGHSPAFGGVSDATFVSLGDTLARFHLAGRRLPYLSHHQLRLWNGKGFFMEFVEIEQELLSRREPTELDRRVLGVLRAKASFVERNRLLPNDIPLPFDCLLHGDFIPQNTFVDDRGAVSHVFDLEKTCIGPRAYEAARSVLVSCFDDGWADRNFAQARLFLDAYRSRFPISFEDFYNGVRMYAVNLQHMTWIEARYALFNNSESMPLYERHAKRVETLAGDVRPLCDRIFS